MQPRGIQLGKPFNTLSKAHRSTTMTITHTPKYSITIPTDAENRVSLTDVTDKHTYMPSNISIPAMDMDNALTTPIKNAGFAGNR